MAITDNWSYVRLAAIGLLGQLMGQSAASAESKFLSLKDDNVVEDTTTNIEQSGQRMDVIEQSLNSLLEMAKSNPSVLSSLINLEQASSQSPEAADNKAKVREKAVSVMHTALACWEHDLGKSKLGLAEESKIWPVYIDKSTPTTRTLDKYLHLDSCPKNPRCQRVVDTAEFVIRQLGDQQTPHKQKLMNTLETLRKSMSGI